MITIKCQRRGCTKVIQRYDVHFAFGLLRLHNTQENEVENSE